MESADVLNKIMEREGLNPNSLSKAMKITRSQPIYDILSGKIKYISRDYAEKIISAFPKYNKVWIILGEGSMLKDNSINGESTSTNANGNTGGINGNVIGSVSGNINGNGNHVGITQSDCEKELMKSQCESDYLKKEVKTLKEQLKQALSDKEKAISDKDMAMSMLNKALSK